MDDSSVLESASPIVNREKKRIHDAIREVADQASWDEVEGQFIHDPSILEEEDDSKERFPVLIAMRNYHVSTEQLETILKNLPEGRIGMQRDAKKQNLVHYALTSILMGRERMLGTRREDKTMEIVLKYINPTLAFEEDHDGVSAWSFSVENDLNLVFISIVRAITESPDVVSVEGDREDKFHRQIDPRTIAARIRELFHQLAYNRHWGLLMELILVKKDLVLTKNNKYRGYTILHQVVSAGESQHVEQLMDIIPVPERYEVLECKDKDNRTVFHLASGDQANEMVETLIENCPLDRRARVLFIQDENGRTPLHIAAREAQLNTITLLVESLPEEARQDFILIQDFSGQTALHAVVKAEDYSDTNQGLDKGQSSEVVKIIKFLVENCPRVVAIVDREEVSAYRMVDTASKASEKILDFLLIKTLEMDSMSGIRDILYGKDRGSELSLELSMFDNRPKEFDKYLSRLVQQKGPRNKVRYERILKSIKLPELVPTDSASPTNNRKEAFALFEWLSKCSVRRVLSIEVPDCLSQPHADEVIVDCLKLFSPKRLIWRKKDLAVQTLLQGAPGVEELRLYTGGNLTVLSQWVSPLGLCLLNDLKRIEVIILRGKEPDETLMKRKKQLESDLKQLRSHRSECTIRIDEKNKIVYDCKGNCRRKFDGSDIHVYLMNIGQEAYAAKKLSNSLRDQQLFFELRPIHDFYQELQSVKRAGGRALGRRVRVAVIDCGVDAFQKSIQKNLVTGRSFVEDKYSNNMHLSHWHTVTHPHGTQMTYLICNIDPLVDIYVAKVSAGATDADVRAVAEAIKWARYEGVDIISMSLSFSRDAAILRNALDTPILRNATDSMEPSQMPLLFASTGDKGGHSTGCYPASFGDCFAISAATSDGKEAAYAESIYTDFSLPGEKIEAVDPDYISPEVKVITDGSSVATALAAGLAALVLSLVRYTYPAENPETTSVEFSEFKQHHQMEKVFNDMRLRESRINFIRPDTLFRSNFRDFPLEKGVAELKHIFDRFREQQDHHW